ncbi:hypothetical protein GSI_09084 [Ganoderma sinense ZZ0214-1]|uniref:non-specific serine/threonine protein kinase n=1 Tax=Ganoderma sinense ZZ0214-1 TaxID=1077348 RepID=A0A2G8S5I3_9APHY|nr:hypothetical protein GSI_09084 [Ganoderma sinense ZZ0214-1]
MCSHGASGYGSSGTLVLKGTFRGRDVAVKRMMSHFVKLVVRELDILRKSDSHPNIIRYFYDTRDAHFQYIALELCPASLADIMDVERRDQLRHIVASFVPKRALREITSGLRHLHGLRLVHRDIKPQNILVSDAQGGHRMLISDFGLCKQLETGRMSYNPTTEGVRAAGTVGWRAPEVLRGEVKLDGNSVDAGGSHQLSGSSTAGAASVSVWSPTRQTQFVDIFALGCLYYYVFTEGAHPFGAGVEVESNILKNAKNLERLKDLVAVDAIQRMLSPKAEDRPDATACLLHPCLWDADKVLMFLQEASDCLQNNPKELLDSLENGGQDVVGQDWCALLHPEFIAHFSKRRRYNGRSVRDLLRLVRNARHHLRELPDGMRSELGTVPEGFLTYFTNKFPKVFLHVYDVISSSLLRNESAFRSHF